MEQTKLSSSEILQNGFALGIKNFGSLVINVILFLLTFWIPYLNVGTFIGLMSGIPLKMSKGKIVSPTEIFNREYRKYFGEYFLLYGLKMVGVYVGLAFMLIPGFILSLAWILADLLFLDGKETFINSLQKSNELMYNNKMPLFLSVLLFYVVIVVIVLIASLIGETFTVIAVLILAVLFIPVIIGIKAYVYKRLTGTTNDNTENSLTE